VPAGSNAGSKQPRRIDMGKAGSIACLEELEEAGKKKQMAEWSSERYAARCVSSPLTNPINSAPQLGAWENGSLCWSWHYQYRPAADQ
jgi:hypothetical protein